MEEIINHDDFMGGVINGTFPRGGFNYIDVKILECCGDENDIKISDGYIICALCGLVLSGRISENAEWTNYTDGGIPINNSRCGNSTKTTDINPFPNELASFVPRGLKNIYFQDGKMISYDISKLHIQTHNNYFHKSFNNVENQLDKFANDKYSGRIIMTAKLLWAEIMKLKKITRSGVRKGLIACCLYYACIHYDCTRSPLEICKDFGMSDTRNFNKGDREFQQTFENSGKWAHLLTKTSNSDDYFNRFCSNLESRHIIKEGMAFKLAKECHEIYTLVKKYLVGIFPKNAAGGILLWVLKYNKIPVAKYTLSKILGICGSTLTKTYEIVEELISVSPL